MIFAVGVAFAALAVCMSLFIRVSYLVILDNYDGTILLRERKSEGESFSISFIHSVNQSPVIETYQIINGQIVLTTLEFETFGAGMPTELEQGQSLTRLPNGNMFIEGIDRNVGNFYYAIGHNYSLAINFGERQIPFDSFDATGQMIFIAYRQLNIWQRI